MALIMTGYSLGISITHMNSINKPYLNGLSSSLLNTIQRVRDYMYMCMYM